MQSVVPRQQKLLPRRDPVLPPLLYCDNDCVLRKIINERHSLTTRFWVQQNNSTIGSSPDTLSCTVRVWLARLIAICPSEKIPAVLFGVAKRLYDFLKH